MQETVFIDSSSSAYYVVREMIDNGLAATILTNSVPVMHIVGKSGTERLDLIGLGGNFRRLTRSTGRCGHGPCDPGLLRRPCRLLREGHRARRLADRPDPLESEVKRAMINRARNAVLVADARKFDERGLTSSPTPVAHHAWLADPPSGGVALLDSAGVDVTQV